MVGPARAPSRKSSSRNPTIRGSEASDLWTPSNRVIQNLNPEFNVVRLQTIIVSIQCIVPQFSPLVTLALDGVEAVSQIVATEPSAGNHQANLPLETSLTSANRHLANNDA
jgi:hypothetical protein